MGSPPPLEGAIMTLSNYPPGVTDSDIDAHFGDEDDEQEEAHYPHCGTNRVFPTKCDCWWDS